jgi:hypothetical protein
MACLLITTSMLCCCLQMQCCLVWVMVPSGIHTCKLEVRECLPRPDTEALVPYERVDGNGEVGYRMFAKEVLIGLAITRIAIPDCQLVLKVKPSGSQTTDGDDARHNCSIIDIVLFGTKLPYILQGASAETDGHLK